ncbi:F-box/LRR-repeat protein At5g63520-like isoform X1 [Solanum verrucosum]|uniref:F-box/LRR-repeat protein At5g63520-like isoform X1 n=1 Tax=Solanum verrucosum TaxID=315347 RepID=UPI0020D0147D|nr:F-box/LRR-repeat protein At5g63520-like isoform X1 [Solanum verrucosum]
MDKPRQKPPATALSPATIDMIGEDLLFNIFSKLPAVECAAAACVSRSWNATITRLLSLPKLSSAVSLDPSLQVAVNDVIDKVLACPIRPQFVIASIGPAFDLDEAHRLIAGRFGSQIPVITSISQGIFGQNATTNEFEEVQWDTFDEEEEAHADLGNEIHGALLTVGFLPGLAIDLIPLSKTRNKFQGNQVLMIDDLVLSVRERSSSRSGSASPVGILLFSDEDTDIKLVLEKFDYAFSAETVIVGDGGSQFLYRGETAINPSNNKAASSAAVALLFSRDRGKPPGVGETQFHVMLSTGISSIGPTYKAVSVRERSSDYSTWLTAKREAVHGSLDGQTILDQIYDELGGHNNCPVLYVGVTKRRKCSIGQEKPSWISTHEFHEVLRGDEEYLYVHGVGIRSGDSFRFYHASSDLARASCNTVANNFRHLKQLLNYERDDHTNSNSVAMQKKPVFGGIMFACCGRGKLFFGEPNVDGSPFLENFSGVTFSGTYCTGEIARADLSSYEQGSQEHSSIRCNFHVFSTVYLVMSYTPPSPQH